MTNAIITAASPSPIVHFIDDEIDYSTPRALSELKDVNYLAVWLENELTRSGREMGVNREYLKKVSWIPYNPFSSSFRDKALQLDKNP